MSDRIRFEDDPALRDKINREAAERGEPPHIIIRDMAVTEEREEWTANMDAFIKSTNELIEKAHPEQRKFIMGIRDDYFPVLHHLLDLKVRRRAASIEKTHLGEELKALGPRTEEYAPAAAQLSDKHLQEDQKLAASHDKDLRMLHGEEQPMLHYLKELMDGERDRIRGLQTQELDNLKGRQEVETSKLTKELSQEPGRDRRDNRDRQQSRSETAQDPSDGFSRRVGERLKELQKRRKAERKHGKDRDGGRGRD